MHILRTVECSYGSCTPPLGDHRHASSLPASRFHVVASATVHALALIAYFHSRYYPITQSQTSSLPFSFSYSYSFFSFLLSPHNKHRHADDGRRAFEDSVALLSLIFPTAQRREKPRCV
jgi:hypothetical protein